MHHHRHVDKLLPAFLLGELAEAEVASVHEHLAQCPSCRHEAQRLEKLLTYTNRIEDVSVDEQTCQTAGRQVLLAVQNKTKAPSRPGLDTDGALLWRMIMRSPRTKLTTAAAAAVVVMLLLIVPFGTSGVTFAEVIQPILNAQTVIMDTIVGEDEDGPIIHDIVKGSRIRRTSPDMPNIMILDLDAGRMLTFDPATKGAAYLDIQGMIQEGTKSYLGMMREIVTRLDDRPDLPVEQLGRQEIDGRQAVGFQVTEGPMTLTIWADPESRMPVRIEIEQGQSFTIVKNIEFDVPVADDLVSMDVPEGYAVADTEFDMTEFSEEDFVETLRLWAELLLDGKFPDRLKLEDLFEAPIDQQFGQLDLSPEEHMQLGTKLARGYMFLLALTRGDGYTYAGKGVKLGDADEPIFWYRPQGSETYRVFYGDLSARDVTPESLPTFEDSSNR